jgi:formyl-CoA transferase
MMSVTGERDAMPGGGPQRAGVPVIDIMTGVYAAFAVVTALRERDRTGRGQVIDLALLDVQVSALSYFGMNYLASGTVPTRMGNSNPVTFPSGNFEASDRPVVLLVGNDAQFARFSEALGRPELAADERFRTSPQRVKNASALTAIIAPIIAGRPSAHWMSALEERGVPCGPINDLRAVFDDPQVRARGNVARAEHPVFGEIPILANPVRMSGTPASYDVPPPLLGEHTADVLAQVLGMSGAQIEALRAKGAI